MRTVGIRALLNPPCFGPKKAMQSGMDGRPQTWKLHPPRVPPMTSVSPQDDVGSAALNWTTAQSPTFQPFKTTTDLDHLYSKYTTDTQDHRAESSHNIYRLTTAKRSLNGPHFPQRQDVRPSAVDTDPAARACSPPEPRDAPNCSASVVSAHG